MASAPTIPQTQNNAPQDDAHRALAADRALIEKHKDEVIKIMDMDPEGKKVTFKILGIDPDEIKNKPEYSALQKQNKVNESAMNGARKKVNLTTGLASLASFVGLMFASSSKREKPIFGSTKGIKGIYITLLTVGSALTSYFFSTKLFTGKIAREGETLSETARDSEMLEIARALEKRGKSTALDTNIEASVSPATETKQPGAQAPENTNAKPASSAVPPLPSHVDRVQQTADNQAVAGRY